MPHAGMISQHTRSQAIVALVTASRLSAPRAMGKTYRQVDDTERRLVKNMRKVNLTWDVIQRITERSSDTLNNIIKPTTSTPKTKGRPAKVPVKILPKILKTTTRLQKKAKAEEEVTADMILRQAGVSACARTLQRTFKVNGIKFKKLKEKLAQTEGDVIDRLEWATDHMKVSADGWNDEQHAIIDNSKKPMYINAKGRAYAARRKVRGG